MEKLRLGIIGCGGIANNKQLPSIKLDGGADVVALCVIIEGRAVTTAHQFGTPDAKVYAD